jgi:hypothetical protein
VHTKPKKKPRRRFATYCFPITRRVAVFQLSLLLVPFTVILVTSRLTVSQKYRVAIARTGGDLLVGYLIISLANRELRLSEGSCFSLAADAVGSNNHAEKQTKSPSFWRYV